MRKHYKTLGVDEQASPEQIKKAYRKLARQCHPDRNPGDKQAEARFKEISEAHDVLGDPEKRRAYDAARDEAASPFGPDVGFADLGDIFGSTGKARSRHFGPMESRGQDLEVEASVTFAQAMAGSRVRVQAPSEDECPVCHGSGGRPGTGTRLCPACEGRGIEASGQGLFSISHACSRCAGAGTVMESPCERCKGSGSSHRMRTYRVSVPAGARDGTRVRLPGRGGRGGHGGERGDLYVIMRVAGSQIFERRGDDLEVRLPLTIPEALLGAEVSVPTISGDRRLRVRPGTQPGTRLRLRGEGPPVIGEDRHGDIHYVVDLDMPCPLTPEQDEAVGALARLLPKADRSHLRR
jgi:molecular chaperone DnaJ